MEIRINEDGSARVTTAGYIAFYDKEGRLKMVIGRLVHTTGELDPVPQRLTDILPVKLITELVFKQKAEKEQASKTYDAGMTLSVDTGNKAGITADTFKAFDVAGNVYVKEAVIDAKAIRASHDDHVRQIVREEIRQFVNRESRCGGLFSRR
ncbi:hypothetical protein XBP1_2490025 [Xenorhabdus bovienii str. puntauvense]|uniref:Uncharacterized protein n=2 Tax=Xenorhabdus bovienii TaxID=40576 RepID=A0A077NFP9_XENBV|nr:hypothetical protein XBP1_2490025 [Xenorhabdus bovienii str. puntauvense]